MYSSNSADGTIQGWIRRNKSITGKNKVEIQNFYKEVMKPYYDVTDWSTRVVVNNGLKLKITPTEQGSKRLTNNFAGRFTGLTSTSSSQSVAFVLLDDYIMNMQGTAARKMAEDIYSTGIDIKTGKKSGWGWAIWGSNEKTLQYFLTDETIKKDPTRAYRIRINQGNRVIDYDDDNFSALNSDKYYNAFRGEFSYLNQWEYALQRVTTSSRSGSVDFILAGSQYGGGTIGGKNKPKGLEFQRYNNSLDFIYASNNIAVNRVNVYADNGKGLYYWIKKKQEGYKFEYNTDGTISKLNTYYNLADFPKVLPINYGNFKADGDLKIHVEASKYDLKGNPFYIYKSGNTQKVDLDFYDYPSRSNLDEAEINDIITFDYNFTTSKLKMGVVDMLKASRVSIYNVYWTVYEVSSEGETQRLLTFNSFNWDGYDDKLKIAVYDYNTGKTTEESYIPNIVAGRTYHIYQGSYDDTEQIWYKLDSKFWQSHQGKHRVPYKNLPKNVFDKCKNIKVEKESSPQFAFRFTPKGAKKMGEQDSKWQTENSSKIGTWLGQKNDFTVEARIKLEKGDATILHITNSIDWKIENGKVVVTLNDVEKVISNKTLAEGKWYHLAFVYKKASKEVTIYINTEQDKVKRIGTGWNTMVGFAGTKQKIRGSGAMILDDLAIWNSARTRQQLIQSATSKTLVLGNDLFLKYDFSNGIGDRNLLDLSPTKVNGLIIGGDCYCDYEKSDYEKQTPVSASIAYDYVLDFDGDEYVDVSNINLQNGAFTAEGWIKVKSITKDATFISLGNTKLQVKQNGAFTNKFKLHTTAELSDNSTKTMTTHTSFEIDKWYYVALVQDDITSGKTNLRIIVGGAQEAQLKNILPIKVNANLRIGGDGTTNANAVMDEWRVWSIARKISSIAYTVRNGIETTMDMSKQLVYYDFDKGGPGKTILTDVSVNGKDGALTQMEANEDWILSDRRPVPSVTGNYGIRYDGNNDYAVVTHSDKLNIGNNFTFEFWAKSKTALSGHTWLVLKQNSYGVYVRNNNELNISTWGEDGNFGAHTYIIDDTWHHYTIAGESGKGVNLYIDGIFIKNVSGNYSPNKGGDNLYIGGVPNNVKNPNVQMDNFIIWNKTLPLSDIQKNAVTPSTNNKEAVLYQNYDAGAGKIVLGRSPNRLNGVLTTDMKDDDWISQNGDLVGDRAIDFDGTDDYLEGEKIAMEIRGYGFWNVELGAWINVDKLNNIKSHHLHIAGLVDSSLTIALRLAKVENQWKIQGVVALSSGERYLFNTPTSVQPNKWYKIDLKLNRKDMELRVNNKLVDSQKFNHNNSLSTNSDRQIGAGLFTVGGHKNGNHFDGLIDNVYFNIGNQKNNYAFDEFKSLAYLSNTGEKLTAQNADIKTNTAPANKVIGLSALIFPNPDANIPAITSKEIYTIAYDKSFKGYVGFNIGTNETVEAVNIFKASDKSELLFWEKGKSFIRYNYKVVNGKKVLDGINKSPGLSALHQGDVLPLNLPEDTYRIEVKIGGTWYKATHTIGKTTVFTPLVPR